MITDLSSLITLSVVIRTRNEAVWIGRVLQALREQTFQPIEVILVDSGSTDETVEIARSYGATIISISSEEFSYGRALNIGFASSQGSIVLSLSGHAVPAQTHSLEHLVRVFEHPRVAAASSRLVPPPTCRPLHNYLLHWPFYVFRAQTKNNLLVFWNTAAAYRRTIWERIHFNEQLREGDDRDWGLRARSFGYDIVYEPKSVIWHQHGESYKAYLQRCLRIAYGVAHISSMRIRIRSNGFAED